MDRMDWRRFTGDTLTVSNLRSWTRRDARVYIRGA